MTDFPNSTRKAAAVLAVTCVTTFCYQVAGNNVELRSNTDLTAAFDTVEEQEFSVASVLAVSRTRIDFGAVAVGEQALESLTLTNTSTDQPLTVTSLILDNQEFAQFFLAHSLPLTLAPQQSTDIAITFLPEDIAIASGKLIINVQDQLTLINLVGAGARSGEPQIAAANPVSAQAWKTISDIKNPRFESSMVQYRDDLYVFNGFGVGIDAEATIEKFDAGTQKWEVIGKTSKATGTAVTHNGVVKNGNEVWMLGGRIGDHPGPVTANVWIYNLNTKKWSAGPKLPVPTAAGGAALINNRVHWFGGLDKKAQCDVSNHYVYDLGKPSEGWKDISSVAPMPVPRNHFATVVFEGLIYAIGGQFTHGGCGAGTPDTNLVHAFNPKTNNWTQKASLPAIQSHTEPSTFVHKGAIYVVGGATKGNKVYRYDSSNDIWETVAELPKELLAPIARVIDDKLIVSSGGAPSIVPSETTYITDMAPLLLSGKGNTNNTDNSNDTAITANDDNSDAIVDNGAKNTSNTDSDNTQIAQTASEPTPASDSTVDAGLVVLEAEYYDSISDTDSHQWEITNRNGASNGVAIITTPDNNTSSKGSQGSPSVGHFAYFDRPGTWYLWLRGWGDTINGEGSSDSVHAGLNGSLSDTADQIDNFPPGWTWSNHTRDNTRAKLNIPSKGIHAVNLWMREDGLTIDKILLTTDSSYTPSGAGPSVEAESLPVNPQTTNNNSSANTVTVANTVDSGEAPSNDSTHVTAVFDNTPVSTEVTVNTQSGNNSNGIENENPANTNSVATAPTAQGDNSGIVATNNTNTDATDNSNRNDDTNSFTAPTTQDNNSGGGALDLLLLITMLGGLIVRMMAGKR